MASYDASGRLITERQRRRPRGEVAYDTVPDGELPGQVRKNVTVGGEVRGGQDYAMGMTVPPGLLSGGSDAAFFANQQAEAIRRAKASVPYDTSAYLDILEGRGLGRSSIAGEGVRGIQANANMLAQQGVQNVQSLQYQARQQRINAYLNYLYQSKLQKQGQDQGMFGSLFSIGKILPFILAPSPATAATALGASDATVGLGPGMPYQTAYDPYHNAPRGDF